MKLNWSVDDIENKLKNAKLYIDDNTIRKQLVYSCMLTDLNDITSSKSKFIEREEFFEKLKDFDLSYFYSPFFNLISYVYDKLHDIKYISTLEAREKKEPEDIVKYCKFFYKQVDKDSFSTFKRIVKNDNCIHFMDNIHNRFMGRTYYINQDEYYILINGRNYIEDSLALVHEIKHVDMNIRGYNNGLKSYSELAPILYEMYMIDYLEDVENIEDIGLIRVNNINKYVELIKNIGKQMELIKNLKSTKLPGDIYEYIYNNYNDIYNDYKLEDIYKVLCNGYSKRVISEIISFMVAIDIYLNVKPNNINNVLALYIFGIYKIKPDLLDSSLEYIEDMYRLFGNTKIKKK